jgi:poly-gamma-glutamate capsule biosynthesis protein CapA/YwtB (metallophosphatase superfamily)
MRLPTRICSFLIYPFLLYSFLVLPGEHAPPVLGQAEGSSLTIAFVGDVMLGRGVTQALDGNWEAACAEVQPWLAEADFAFGNLESPLTMSLLSSPPVGGRYDLRAPLEAVAALRAGGFDLVSLANNHALDAGETGLQETVEALRAAGIGALVNGGAVESMDCPSLPSCRSADLPGYGFLAFDDSVAPLDVESAAEAVAAAARRSNVVVVSIHWGGEYQASPSPRQRAIARALADAGAGLVVGHGPHVLQRVEWVGGTLVAYSLGNFLFDQPYPADCRWGAILRVTLQGDRIVAVEPVPTIVERGRVRPAGPEDAASILARLNLEP